jgi:hypothetical protein
MDLALLCVIGILIIVLTHMIFKMAVLMASVD